MILKGVHNLPEKVHCIIITVLCQTFSDYAVVKYPKSTGFFDEARDKFNKDKKYRDNAEVTDEIWFFFDVEMISLIE